ncbi:unnamed protein product [Merluccius merluccius]
MGKEDVRSTLEKVSVLKVRHADDPVINFEKWKKKYQKTKIRVKKERARGKKPDWQVEREQIDKLVSRYDRINAQDAVKFSDFPISRKTLRGLMEGQYRQPTEIQRQTIGFALQGKDVLGAAKTGSGKTLAFLVPVLESLYRHQWTAMDGLGALIISPTRELAYQTFEVLRKVGKNHEFSAGLIIGGKDLKTEAERIHRTNIVVCTPGRLLQHMDETATFHVSDLHVLVLDEADRILDMGFADTLNAIVENLPRSRQTLLFSATQTKSVKDLARLSLKDPEYVWVHERAMFSTPATLEQNFVVCELHQKVDVLFSFVRSHLQKKVIVFFACCKEVQYLFRAFCRLRPGTPVLALHGKQQQMKRMEVYKDFVGKKSAVLFATDIAARGLDFPAVNWVLQFDCPEDADTYIHRVGRTARYKEGGEALLVLLPSEEEGMVAQLKDKKVPINKIQVNPDKLQHVQLKLEAFLAQEMEQKERAQRCFVSYLRSVHLMKNKNVFDVFQLKIHEYALSLGLAVAPRVRFLNKAQEQKKNQKGLSEHEQSEDTELRQFKAKLRGEAPATEPEPTEPEQDEKESTAALFLGAACDDDDDDLREVDLLTVKRRDVFSLAEDLGGEDDDEFLDMPKGKKVTTLSEAKKILKRKFQVNTKITFSEEGETVQQWPIVQRSAVQQSANEELEEEFSGINVDKARERLKREDQEFDKQEYNRKIKEKKREKRLKAKAARREASKRTDKSDEEEEEEEEETVAYLDYSGDEFDPSTLPDPDKPQKPSADTSSIALDVSGGESSCEDNDMSPPASKRKRVAHRQPLDTGLSLAEDEELVLRLLGSS